VVAKQHGRALQPAALTAQTLFLVFRVNEEIAGASRFVDADALVRKFHETHDMAVKDELERLLKEYGKLKEPWVFVSR
jgi:hypothetical protein